MFFQRKKTELKKWHWYAFIMIVFVACALKVYSFYWPKAIVVTPQGRELKVLVADTPSHQARGLGKRDNLGHYDGMLFIFGDRGQHTMVMRAMRFSIDIVWLDNGEIVDIAPLVPVENGVQEGELALYFARAPSNRVLELPAGRARELGLKIGDELEIKKI